ncbi:MAG: manganese transporter, partial [Bacteroidota bacterium]
GCRQKGFDVSLGGNLFSDAMGAENTLEGTYVGMVRSNVLTIVNALK